MQIITISVDEFRGILQEELKKLSLNKPSPAEPRKYLSVKELSGYIHLSLPAIYQRVSDGSIPFKRAGSRILFEVEKIDNWLLDGRPAQYFK